MNDKQQRVLSNCGEVSDWIMKSCSPYLLPNQRITVQGYLDAMSEPKVHCQVQDYLAQDDDYPGLVSLASESGGFLFDPVIVFFENALGIGNSQVKGQENEDEPKWQVQTITDSDSIEPIDNEKIDAEVIKMLPEKFNEIQESEKIVE